MDKDNLLILGNGTISLYKFRKELMAAVAEYSNVYVSAPDDGFADEIKSTGAHYINTYVDRRKANPFSDIILLLRYILLIRRVKPKVILTYTVKPNIYGNFAARLLKVPVISTVSGLGDGFLNPGMVGKIVRILFTLAFKSVGTIVMQNPADEAAMVAAGIITNQRIIHVPGSGVNLKEHKVLDFPNPKDADNNHISFLYIGRIMHSKGIGELIKAGRRLKNDTAYSFDINLAGFEEADAKDLIKQAEADNIVSSLGFQKDISPALEEAHCVVLPSYSEGMSNALLEAAASGRGLIASDISGCREIVDHGVNGFLCKPKDEESLYHCMKDFLDTTAEAQKQMGKASRDKVVKQFDRDIVTNTMIEEILRYK